MGHGNLSLHAAESPQQRKCRGIRAVRACAEVAVDAKLVLRQLIDEARKQLGSQTRRGSGGVASEIKMVKDEWLRSWLPRLTADEVPINPYRVVWDLAQTLDRTRAIVTHDSGNPRDQSAPFYQAPIPRGYLGWGNSTQLGSSLGFAMGAKLAQPDKVVVNLLGDAALSAANMTNFCLTRLFFFSHEMNGQMLLQRQVVMKSRHDAISASVGATAETPWGKALKRAHRRAVRDHLPRLKVMSSVTQRPSLAMLTDCNFHLRFRRIRSEATTSRH